MKKKQVQTIAIVIAVALVGIGFWFTWQRVNPKPEPKLVFKDNITFKVGQKSFEDEGETPDPALPTITVASIIDIQASDYDEASFNKVPCGNEPQDMMFRFVDTGDVGSYEGTVYAAKGNVCKTYTFNYKVEA